MEEGEKIFYFDFTSLYPDRVKSCKYNFCHPDIITRDFDESLESYEVGVAQCKIHPPRGLYLPLLPTLSQDRLKFGLCRKCMEEESQELCQCSYEERCLTGTWTTAELRKALELGYTLEKIHEVYNYPDWCQYDPNRGTEGLFSEFINFFLK